MTNSDHSSGVSGPTFFGHPRGLMTLFFTELWERFSYYGMRGLLVLFMTAPMTVGGLEWNADRAGAVYGTYTALVYLVALPGGWIADRIMGQRRSVLWGGVIIMAGHIALALHGLSAFYIGMALIIAGTGLLKPNISAMVGQLYSDGDARRDSGFSIFYMGINIGAGIAPLICGWLAEGEAFRGMLADWGMDPKNSWHWGFGAAAVGMGLGLIQYVMGGKYLSKKSLTPPGAADPEASRKDHRNFRVCMGSFVAIIGALIAAHFAGVIEITVEKVNSATGYLLAATTIGFFAWLFLAGDWTKQERKRLTVVAVLFVASAVFWSVFEQAGSTLSMFAAESTTREFLGFEIPASWFQSLNAGFIVLLAPVFAWLWMALKDRDPSSPAKFTIGLVFVGLGFGVLVFGAQLAQNGERVSPLWLVSVYLLHTIGELCLSPVGLSAMTKLAPARITGMMMGVWFLSTSVGSFLGGQMSRFYEAGGDAVADPVAGVAVEAGMSNSDLFTYITLYALGAAVLLFLLVKPIKRMLERVD